MSDKKNDGGAAFPSPPEAGFDYGEHGMRLRDYFAAKAMAGCIAYCGMQDPPESISKLCYKWADAMLEASGKC